MKRDFLGECNDQAIPLEDFRLAFCVRCFQPECSRSQYGTSKFESRVNSWQERLFQAPQLPRTDPRYAAIQAKRFLTLAVGPAPNVSTWIDPQTLPVAQEPARVAPADPTLVRPILTPPQIPNSIMESPSQTQLDKIPARPTNTPNAGPQMIGTPEPAKDSWAGTVSQPLKPEERLVKPGARVKMGGPV